MSAKAFILPLRNDLEGMRVQYFDLFPNTSLRTNTQPPGQTGCVSYAFDPVGSTTTLLNAYVSGSRNTSPLEDAVVVGTDGGEDNASVTAVAEFGLLAYLRERIHVNPGGDSDFLTTEEALAIAEALVDMVLSGTAFSLTNINEAINAEVNGNDTDFDGAGNASNSFGDVIELFRILSGETYRTPIGTILGDEGGEFVTFEGRETLVEEAAAVYYAKGGFLTSSESGYRHIRPLALSGSIRGSAYEGQLSKWKNSIKILNPNFIYTGTSPIKPRAKQIDGTNIPSTGMAPVLRVYAGDGTPL